jgi:peptidoglycan/LPS O-acetylase OafA/YrhL
VYFPLRAGAANAISWSNVIKKGEIPQLTGIRGIAAVMVLFWHLREVQTGQFVHFGWLDAIPSFGYLGVDVFFLLSGFILSYAYRSWFADGLRRSKLYDFAVARVARLYPLHLFALALMILAWWAGHRFFHVTPNNEESYTVPAVFANLFLVQEWFRLGSPNPVSWSISVELASYLIFPFAITLTARMPKWWGFAALPVFLAMALLAPVRLLRGVAEFYFGFSAFSLVTQYPPLRLPPWATLAALLLPFYLSFFLGREILPAVIPCFCLAIAGITSNEDWLCRLSRSKPVWYLGEISYSIYMMQWFVWVFFKHAVSRQTSFLETHPYLLIGIALSTILAVASVTYRIIEMPVRRWLVAFAKGRRAVPAVGTAV